MTLYFHPVKSLCNKDCNFCITKQQLNITDNAYPEFVYYKDINLDEINRNKEISCIEVTGGGEPTLHPKICSLLTMLKSTHKKIKLYTNGLSLVTNLPRIDIITISANIATMWLSEERETLKKAIAAYRDKCDILRVRVYYPYASLDVDVLIFKRFIDTYNAEKTLYSLVDQWILGKDFNNKNSLKEEFEKIKDMFPFNIKLDDNEKHCLLYPLLYTDGKIHENWNFILKDKKKSYHIKEIPKGDYGTSKKILEEVNELIDSENQKCKIMSLIELSDIIGAVEGYLETNYPNLTLDDLICMKQITKRVFENGHRN